MIKDWQELTKLTGGKEIIVERVRLAESDITIEGNFKLPPLALLTTEEQIFVAAFVHCHGSIKQMERYFGVSYPTIKSRLNKIASKLEFAESNIIKAQESESPLDRLERGELTVEETIELLKERNKS